MIKGVVFDFDGVLIDSPKIYFRTMDLFLKKHGLVLSRHELSRLISFSMKQEFAELVKKYSLPVSFEEFVKGTLLESKKEMQKSLELHRGVKELLAHLYQSGFSLALASNNNRSVVDWVLKKFELQKFFDAVVPVELVKNPKPAPDIYQKCVELLALKPSECIGIEDTVIGAMAVKAAGLKCIAFPNEFSDKKDFVADLFVESLASLDIKKIRSLGEKE